MFEINNFIKYNGRLNQYKNSIAKIIDFVSFNGNPRVQLLSLESEEEFWADFNEIKHIELTDNHLHNLGFKKEELNSRSKFVKHNIIISKTAVQIVNIEHYSWFFSGFCVGDFTDTELKIVNYVDNSIFNYDKFYNDYPKVNTVTELFHFLNNNGFEFDPVAVLLE